MDTRRPPPLGPPPSYAFVTRVYRSDLRPVVIITTVAGAIWAIASAVGYFRNYSVDRTQNVPKLAVYAIVLGTIYAALFVIELYGLFSSISNRLALVRIYAYLSALSALAVVAAGLLDIIVHFMLKNDIINICSNLTNGNELVYYGFFGPVYHTVITADEAKQYCANSWDHDSWTTIIAFLITSFLAFLFSSIAFGYLHQLRDPTSPANTARAPSNQVRLNGYPSYYNNGYAPSYVGPYDGQPYNTYYGGAVGGHAGANGPYAPPTGPPPAHPYHRGLGEERDDPFVPPEDGKPPNYSGDGKEFEAGDDKEDPFAIPERDLTSRPTPGGRERFT